VGIDEALVERAAKRRAVGEALSPVGVPCVGVGVEQHHPDRAVLGGVGAQLAQDDRVIPADDQRHSARLEHRGQRLGDLARSPLGVARRGRDVTAVDDRQGVEHIHLERRVPAAHHQAHLAHGGRAVARAGAKAHRRVEGDAQDGDVGAAPVLGERTPRVGPHTREARAL
jgi:hypothetical protein